MRPDRCRYFFFFRFFALRHFLDTLGSQRPLAAIFVVCTWALFDVALSLPWPASVRGEYIPSLTNQGAEQPRETGFIRLISLRKYGK